MSIRFVNQYARRAVILHLNILLATYTRLVNDLTFANSKRMLGAVNDQTYSTSDWNLAILSTALQNRRPFAMILMVGGYANDCGTNDFQLECECELSRPGFSPPATLVSEQSIDTPTISYSSIASYLILTLCDVLDTSWLHHIIVL